MSIPCSSISSANNAAWDNEFGITRQSNICIKNNDKVLAACLYQRPTNVLIIVSSLWVWGLCQAQSLQGLCQVWSLQTFPDLQFLNCLREPERQRAQGCEMPMNKQRQRRRFLRENEGEIETAYGMPSAHSDLKNLHTDRIEWRDIKICQDTSDMFELCSAVAKARPATASTDVVVLSLLPQADYELHWATVFCLILPYLLSPLSHLSCILLRIRICFILLIFAHLAAVFSTKSQPRGSGERLTHRRDECGGIWIIWYV